MRLPRLGLVLIAALGCSSEPSFVGDASALADGEASPDAGPSALPPVTVGHVRVVEGPQPLRVVAGVSVRAVNAAGRVLESTTDALGEAALDLSPAEAPWTLTAAQRGRGALSIVGLRGLPEGDLRLDATGFDAVAFHVGESEERLARWRCFVLPESASSPVALPDLPTGITPADLGLRAPVSLVGLLIYMHHGHPWSTALVNGAVTEYRATVGTPYTTVADTWR